jgi:hypothetical protein
MHIHLIYDTFPKHTDKLVVDFSRIDVFHVQILNAISPDNSNRRNCLKYLEVRTLSDSMDVSLF